MSSSSHLKQICGVLNATRAECNLRACLRGGMSFRWTLVKDTDQVQRFIGVLKEKIYVLDQNSDHIEYSAYLNSRKLTDKSTSHLETQVKEELIDYFRLDMNLKGIEFIHGIFFVLEVLIFWGGKQKRIVFRLVK